MKAYGDFESVNLRTGERERRVAGDGEFRLERVNPADLAEYERAMEEECVPEILKAVSERRRLAEEARRRIL